MRKKQLDIYEKRVRNNVIRLIEDGKLFIENKSYGLTEDGGTDARKGFKEVRKT